MSSINESAIKTPGVYVNEIPSFPPSVAQVSTAIPIFIGYTEIAKDAGGNSLTKKPTKIFSLLEYTQFFGKAFNEKKIIANVQKKVTSNITTSVIAGASISEISDHNMYYSLRHYFDNGGGPCYILSVGGLGDDGTVKDTELEDGLNIAAAYDEPTIIVFPEGPSLAEDKYYALIEKAIAQCAKLQDRFTLVDVLTLNTTDTTTTNINNFRSINPHNTGFKKNDQLNYAAAYYPGLVTSYEYQYEEKNVDVIITTITISTDDNIPPVETVAPAVKLDGLKNTDKATYYKAIEAIGKHTLTLPPSPAIAGVYAKVDGERGVWKAPANVSLSSVVDLTDIVTDQEQETMNIDADTGKSVNAIRSFSGKGILVWGARTLDGNSNEWRYISVRRFFIMVEESVKKATASFVFEPNDANTWIRIRAMIENYLTLLWRQGALAGAKPEHAFFVKVGLGQTMSAIDILEGRLIVEIGMAAVRPAEFIILRFSHKMQES